MQLVEREMLYTGGKRENRSRRARNLKVKPQGDGAEKRPPIAVSGLQRGAGRGVRMCGKGRSALRPPNTGRFHALETRPHPVSKRARGGAVCVGQEDAVAGERRSWKGALLAPGTFERTLRPSVSL